MVDTLKGKRALEILQEAKTLLEESGWIGGPRCLASECVRKDTGTAIPYNIAVPRLFTPFGAIRYAGRHKGDDWVGAVSWLKMYGNQQFGLRNLYELNTQPAMTQELMLACFDATIARIQLMELKHGPQ